MKKNKTDFDLAISIAADISQCTVTSALSGTQTIPEAEARQIASMVLWTEGYSKVAIALFFGRPTAGIRLSINKGWRKLLNSKAFNDKVLQAKARFDHAKQLRIAGS